MKINKLISHPKHKIFITLLAFYLLTRCFEFITRWILADGDGEFSSNPFNFLFSSLYIIAISGIILYLLFTFFTCSTEHRISVRSFSALFAYMLLLFIISANFAWLNPRPSFRERKGDHVKLSETMPLFWQYNIDSKLELETAQFFPSYYETVRIRINRPVYPLLANILGKLVAPGFLQTRASAGSRLFNSQIWSLYYGIGVLIFASAPPTHS